MLHVLCRIGGDAYAISGAAVERILPFASLKTLPGSVRGLSGLLNYQGHSVPVIDLCLLLAGHPAREVLGTRLLLCPLPDAPSGRIGLLVEEVSEVASLEDDAFQPAGARGDDCLDGVVTVKEGLLQRIDIPKIIPPEVWAGLDLTAAP